ncbi:MAG: FAD-binding protein, partial [Methanothrix sp.]|nr:FAD-binding protein [Methanothrix sp.]
STNAVLQQPGRVSYTLLDEQIKRTTIESEPIRVAQEGYYGPEGTDWVDIENDLRQEADKGAIKISNSWDEIAKWIGANPKTLKATIDEYNLYCDHGHDDLFAKDRRYLLPLRTPPYYALSGRLMVITTQGGIRINHHMEVLDSQGDPIPGLYAGGDVTGGWEPETYNVHLSGSGLGFALNAGRIAGENAAKYITGK